MKKEKKGEWGAILPTVSSPKASSFLVWCLFFLFANQQNKISKLKRGEMKEEKL
jgi:hypothetical protein